MVYTRLLGLYMEFDTQMVYTGLLALYVEYGTLSICPHYHTSMYRAPRVLHGVWYIYSFIGIYVEYSKHMVCTGLQVWYIRYGTQMVCPIGVGGWGVAWTTSPTIVTWQCVFTVMSWAMIWNIWLAAVMLLLLLLVFQMKINNFKGNMFNKNITA